MPNLAFVVITVRQNVPPNDPRKAQKTVVRCTCYTLKNDTVCLGSPVLRAKLEIFCTSTNPGVPMIVGNLRFNVHAEFQCVGHFELPASGEVSEIASYGDRTTSEWTVRRAISSRPRLLVDSFLSCEILPRTAVAQGFQAQGVVFEYKRMVVCPSKRC